MLAGRICRRLDGIPLAIELAAARLRAMSVTELEARLDQRFSILTGGSRAALPRQQTLLAMVDWSWELLTCLRAARARAAVGVRRRFRPGRRRGGHAGEGVRPDEVIGHLGALVDKNLVQFDDTGTGPARYRLLETVRQYAARQLEAGSTGRRQHDARMATVTTTWPWRKRRPHGSWHHDQAEWLDRLDLELDNLRAAIAFSLRAGRPGARHPAGRFAANLLEGTRARLGRGRRAPGAPGPPGGPGGDATARPGPGHRGLPARADGRLRDRRGILRRGSGHCPLRRGRLPGGRLLSVRAFVRCAAASRPRRFPDRGGPGPGAAARCAPSHRPPAVLPGVCRGRRGRPRRCGSRCRRVPGALPPGR